jgi:hypothetical protein
VRSYNLKKIKIALAFIASLFFANYFCNGIFSITRNHGFSKVST